MDVGIGARGTISQGGEGLVSEMYPSDTQDRDGTLQRMEDSRKRRKSSQVQSSLVQSPIGHWREVFSVTEMV